jgi:hypothetical protein
VPGVNVFKAERIQTLARELGIALVAKLEAEPVTCEFGKSNRHVASVGVGAVRLLFLPGGRLHEIKRRGQSVRFH